MLKRQSARVAVCHDGSVREGTSQGQGDGEGMRLVTRKKRQVRSDKKPTRLVRLRAHGRRRRKIRSERQLEGGWAQGHGDEAVRAIETAVQEEEGVRTMGQLKDEKVHSRCAKVTPGQNDAGGEGDGREKGEVGRGGLERPERRLRRG